jgi:hypothetical protein
MNTGRTRFSAEGSNLGDESVLKGHSVMQERSSSCMNHTSHTREMLKLTRIDCTGQVVVKERKRRRTGEFCIFKIDTKMLSNASYGGARLARRLTEMRV